MATPFKDVAIYGDGSGSAAVNHRRACDRLRKQHEIIALMEKFLDDHRDKLAGMAFLPDIVFPVITLQWRRYRGDVILDPRKIARLWPDADWHKEVYRHDRTRIDWFCEVDGVKIVLERAASITAPKQPAVSGRVAL